MLTVIRHLPHAITIITDIITRQKAARKVFLAAFYCMERLLPCLCVVRDSVESASNKQRLLAVPPNRCIKRCALLWLGIRQNSCRSVRIPQRDVWKIRVLSQCQLWKPCSPPVVIRFQAKEIRNILFVDDILQGICGCQCWSTCQISRFVCCTYAQHIHVCFYCSPVYWICCRGSAFNECCLCLDKQLFV